MTSLSGDILIVGGGIAGLTAAELLIAAGYKIALIEARERLGGRIYGHSILGVPFDFGAQWVGPTQDAIIPLLDRFRLPRTPQFSVGEAFAELCGGRFRYAGGLPNLPLFSLWELVRAIHFLDQSTVATDIKRRRWETVSVEAWAAKRFFSPVAKAALDTLTRAVFCVEPGELSLRFFADYLAQGGGLRRVIDVKGGAQQDRVAGGLSQLVEKLSANMQQLIHLGEPVTAIRQLPDAVQVVTHQRSVHFRYCLITVPSPLVDSIAFDPPLPTQRRYLLGRMQGGSVIKTVVAYRTPFWREARLSGESTSGSGAVGLTFDVSPDQDFGALVAFCLADHARQLSDRPAAERESLIVRHLVRLFGPQAAKLISLHSVDWCREPFSGGCYTAVPALGCFGGSRQPLREPIGRLFWAGTETADVWSGTLWPTRSRRVDRRDGRLNRFINHLSDAHSRFIPILERPLDLGETRMSLVSSLPQRDPIVPGAH